MVRSVVGGGGQGGMRALNLLLLMRNLLTVLGPMSGFLCKVNILYSAECTEEASWVNKQHISFVTRLCDAHFR
jgi:hypothetical protein